MQYFDKKNKKNTVFAKTGMKSSCMMAVHGHGDGMMKMPHGL